MIEPIFNAWIFQDNLKKVKSINSKIYKKIEKHFNDKIYYSNTWHCNVWSTFQKNQNFQKESKLCSDLIIVPAKNILQEAFKDWEDIVIMITNKEFKPKVIDTNAWEKMEKDLDE